ncbi:MAG: hypothetical protein Hyperionvirus39_12 [Hyperionvirus sp.]|uniref:Uncharacterized protein n=1 Tax=Hyperionvirus sp. TaxID=2487770 RepID=A0A3G5ACB4_9VIRU|nr:MAG: hypothetical protein Hyperionvirus39_12 [Hyperionvirus sp.]
METLTDDGRWVDSRKNHLVLCIAFNLMIWMHVSNGAKMNQVERLIEKG